MRPPTLALRAGLALLVLLLCAPVPASAVTRKVLCVPDATNRPMCEQTYATLQEALDAADATPEPDAILLAAGTYAGATDLNGAWLPNTEIVGEAGGGTTIEGSGTGPVLQLTGNFTLYDLTIARTAGADVVAQFNDVVLQDVTVTRADSPTAVSPVLQYDGLSQFETRLTHVTVNQGASSAPAAVINSTHADGLTVTSTATGDAAVVGDFLHLHNSKITTDAASAALLLSGASGVTGAQIVNTSPTADGLHAISTTNQTDVALRDVTLVHRADAATGVGLVAIGSPGSFSSQITAVGVAAAGWAQGVCAGTEDPGVSASVTASYSALGSVASGACPASLGLADTGTQTTTADTGIVAAEPAFTDLPAGNYRPATGGNLIDAGDPAPRNPALPDTDLFGSSRVTDGNGDGVSRIDIGAREHPTGATPTTPAPSPSGASGGASTPGPAGGAAAVTMRKVNTVVLDGVLRHATRAHSRPVGVLAAAAAAGVPTLTVTLAAPAPLALSLQLREAAGKYVALPGTYEVPAQSGTTVRLKLTGSWGRRVLARGIYRVVVKGPEGPGVPRNIRVR